MMGALDQKILIITSCTKSKALPLSESGRRVTAMDMYEGQQHVHVRSGVRLLRETLGSESVSVAIVSARFGLVWEDQLIPPYEATFTGMRSKDLHARARELGIPAAVRSAVRGKRLVIFLLGAEYLQTIEPPIRAEPGQRLLFLAKPKSAELLAEPGSVVAHAGGEAAVRYCASLIALKGVMLERFARAVAIQGPSLIDRVCSDSTSDSFNRAIAPEATAS